ncbi:glycosyltransferase [Gordonia insulae]|uniref:4'-demethylrebeccamycin synthase n=1 Tax=Gordonia insulae TaxID=2420509 RepID=A0A3G8JGU2_9ACTN|nr:nucleotide disphospho-sugar-binding domain-containing protein [Gordonia insulae]AZG44223.1 4'-demethylrebeccamycin synthase [Gordonia insulae]
MNARTYLFALVDGGGTVPPELGAARRLVERGHHVTVLAEDSMASDVHATGATFIPWTTAPNRASRRPEDDPYRDWECTNPLELFGRLLEYQFAGPAPAYAHDTAHAIDTVKPDLAVCSFFAVGAMVAAQARGVPFDVPFPNTYLLPVEGMPPSGLGLTPAHGPLTRLRDRVVRSLTLRQWNKGVPALNAVRATYGLPPVEGFFDQANLARKHLVLTSAEFDFPARMPARVRYVGAVLDDPAWTSDAPWTPPPGDAPLVLVALSSTFQDQVGCLQRVIDALAELPVRGYVTTGPAVDPGALTAPDTVTVVEAAPHSRILPHADAVITHAGHGTVVRTLAAGVPIVALPHGRDQADNAVRVSVRGAGKTLSRKASARKIAAATQQVLGDSAYADAAARLGAIIRHDAEAGALVAELEEIEVTETSVTGG